MSRALALSLVPLAAIDGQSVVRPRIALSLGTGGENVTCDGCGTGNRTAMSASAEIGASYASRWWMTLRRSVWTEPDIVEGTEYSSSSSASV